jgi:hypothetical protein
MHGVVLHQRDDDEAAAEGQRANLDRNPRERTEAAHRDRLRRERHEHGARSLRGVTASGARGVCRLALVAGRPGDQPLVQPTAEQDHHQILARQVRGDSAREQVAAPAAPSRDRPPRSPPARRHEADGGGDSDRRHRSAGTVRCAGHPGWRRVL